MKKKMFFKTGNAEAGRGQSLVEIAIIAPLLIFMLIGVFEVGWALRGYLVLVNVNREITRYAVRPSYLDFSTQTKITESFLKVRNYVDTTLGSQLDMDFKGIAEDGDPANTTMIISHVVVNTGLPCEDTKNKCDCSQVTDNDYRELFEIDDFFIHPQMPGQEHQSMTYGPASTSTGARTTRVDFENLITSSLKPQNNQLNCETIKKGGTPGDNNIIITELFFDQPQLFGFPLISNPLTNPVPLYSRTAMRLIGATRGNLTQNVNTIGPVCFAYPFVVYEDNLPAVNATFDILNGNSDEFGGSQDHRGFLAWDPQWQQVDELENELKFPQLSVTNFTDPVLGGTALKVGVYVKSLPGNNAGVNNPTGPNIDNLIGQEIIIPVWDTFNSTEEAYHISKFIRVRIEVNGTDLNGNNPQVRATYLGIETNSCQ